MPQLVVERFARRVVAAGTDPHAVSTDSRAHADTDTNTNTNTNTDPDPDPDTSADAVSDPHAAASESNDRPRCAAIERHVRGAAT